MFGKHENSNLRTYLTTSSSSNNIDNSFKREKINDDEFSISEPVRRVDYIVCAFSIPFFLALSIRIIIGKHTKLLMSQLSHSFYDYWALHPSIQRWRLPQTRIKNYLSSGRYIYRERVSDNNRRSSWKMK